MLLVKPSYFSAIASTWMPVTAEGEVVIVAVRRDRGEKLWEWQVVSNVAVPPLAMECRDLPSGPGRLWRHGATRAPTSLAARRQGSLGTHGRCLRNMGGSQMRAQLGNAPPTPLRAQRTLGGGICQAARCHLCKSGRRRCRSTRRRLRWSRGWR